MCFIYPQQNKLFVWQPNLQHTFHPDSTILYGVHGPSTFTINSQGFRGDEFKNDGTKKYLCIGGSTTECLYLDDKKTWPYLTQQLLTTKYATPSIIGSIGKSGCTIRENYIQLKYYVPQLGKIDGVIMMAGINDLMKRLSRDMLFEDDFRFTAAVEDSFVNTIFLKQGRTNEKTWLRRTALFKVLQNALHKAKPVKWESVQDDRGEVYQAWRNNRQHASAFVDSLPDLSAALAEYERNLQAIYAEAQRQQIQLVLVNQPAIYTDSLSEYANELLWMGGVGDFQTKAGCRYYSPKVLNAALLLYSQRLKLFCTGKPGIKFIDLATQLPRDTSVFYDDCHFNESGARKVAGIISEHLVH
ncbi:MAG TPA: SGNH/GDSL hydrolase family protein [Chitinophagales bacterium]|nr:SGNH/GDSL hydrolase family protein [Chitinophagales bacterium]